MFSVLGTAIERLYGNNLGFDEDKSIFTLVSDVLQVERQLDEWRNMLPAWLQPGCFEESTSAASEPLVKRYQSITVVRYHYMRSLIHRPVVIRLLGRAADYAGGKQSANMRHLRDIGQRSLQICVESSTDLVTCVRDVCMARAQKMLLGTWWCSLYFSKYPILSFYVAGGVSFGHSNRTK